MTHGRRTHLEDSGISKFPETSPAPSGGVAGLLLDTGGVASLNPRLIAGIPPGWLSRRGEKTIFQKEKGRDGRWLRRTIGGNEALMMDGGGAWLFRSKPWGNRPGSLTPV